jgi:hypothetical protein
MFAEVNCTISDCNASGHFSESTASGIRIVAGAGAADDVAAGIGIGVTGGATDMTGAIMG